MITVPRNNLGRIVRIATVDRTVPSMLIARVNALVVTSTKVGRDVHDPNVADGPFARYHLAIVGPDFFEACRK